MSVSLFVTQEDVEYIFSEGDYSVIVKNIFDGAIITVLNRRKVELFAKKISSELVTLSALHYIMKQNFFQTGEPSAVKWAFSVTEGDIEAARVMLSLGGHS
jgi:hypothetical protein